MLRRIRYFQSVVRLGSFSEAAEECHISQSAISQQLQTLEQELGFTLLERKNRKFTLTSAGEYFYRKSLVLIADFECIQRESARIARGGTAVLRLGLLRSYAGYEFHEALARFAEKYPDVSLETFYGDHEEIFNLLQTEGVDLALSDQRRAFSQDYMNLILTTAQSFIEVAARSPLAAMDRITPVDLKNTPCILISSPEGKETERAYYQGIMGFHGEFLYAETLESARLMVVGGKGYAPVEGGNLTACFGRSIARIPLYRGEEPITKNYCAFWKKDNSGFLVEEFAQLLTEQFTKKED